MKTRILVDLERCVGCWTCAMACKTGNDLADDAYRVVVRTLGSGTGIDRPAGVYPELTMGWMPVYSKQCVLCAERLAASEQPYCVYNCPTDALAIGDADDPASAYSSELTRVRDGGYRIFELPAWEDSKPNITYASKK
jgi:Fe-S-cluster-containing dehydrogenase component